MRRFYLVLLGIFLTASTFLVWLSCRGKDDLAEAGKTKVRLQLQWFDQAQFAGFYVALEQGLYKQENLEVEIIPGGYSVNPIQRVEVGQADIGLATGDQVLLAESARRELKALGTVFKSSMACFMSKKSSGINNPHDLVGRRVGVYRGFDTENVLLSILSRQGIPKEKVDIIDAGSLEAFIKDDIEVFPSYLFNEPLLMKDQGIEVGTLAPDDSGVRFYSDTLFTTKDYYKDNRELIKRFLRASTKGWESAQKNPEAAIDLMYRVVRNLPHEKGARQHQLDMLRTASRYLGDGNKKQVLFMDRGRWEDMEKSLVEIGKITTAGHVDTLCDFDILPEALNEASAH